MSEQKEKFLQILKDEDIKDEIRPVLPSYSGKPSRLDVDEIKNVFKEEGIDFDKMDNDFEVWLAMDNLKKSSDIRYVIKSCFKKSNLSCDDVKFKNLKKERLLCLFFRVFDVLPKFTDEAGNKVENSSDSDSSANSAYNDDEVIRKFKDKLFVNITDERYEIDYNKIAEMLPKTVFDSSELRQLMMTTNEGSKIKTLFENCCSITNVEYKAGRLGGMEREIYVPLFFSVFDVVNFPQSTSAEKPQTPPPEVDKKQTVSDDTEIEFKPLTFEQVQAIYNAGKKESAENLGFDICDNVTIYQDMPVTLQDHFWVNAPANTPVFYKCVALINAQTNEITAIGAIEDSFIREGEVKPHLTFESNNIHYEDFKRQREYNVMFIPSEEQNFFKADIDPSSYRGKLYIIECNINYDKLQVTDKPLCIDFGTTNTTVGTYGLSKGANKDDIELVKFKNVTLDRPKDSEMLPTIVYVDSFKDDKPVYKFGYEAKKEIIESDYNTRATVFYEIKRWINSMNTEEELFDKNGGTIPQKIKHEEILKAYLEYVIKIAEQQFKVKFRRLHFTAPVKLKNRFLTIMRKIFPEPMYIIEKNERSLDEGVAIVYHYISEQLRSKSEEKRTGDILILDCGGGTTDLASCNYAIKDSNVGPVLEIHTGFVNGESNFGGNNITFRILQMLKIKIAAHLRRQGNLTAQELIKKDENAILSEIDASYSNKETIYKEFEAAYEEAEGIVPTKFSKYSGRLEKRMIKRNYYYLWQMAEAIKIEFYRSNLVNFDFEKEQDKNICVENMDQYYLYVRSDTDNALKRYDRPMDKVEITIKEISRIICPDIYALLNTLLYRYVGNRIEDMQNLQKFRYRLSGQSCKIALFHDLLKEFVPGKLIRRRTQEESENPSGSDSVVLKKYCIEGSIEYMRDKAKGEIKPIIIAEKPKNIYNIYFEEGGQPSSCIFDQKGEVKVIKRPNNMREAVFRIQDSNHQEKKRVSYVFDMDASQPRYTLEQLFKEMELCTPLPSSEIERMVCSSLRSVDLQRDNGGNPVYCLFVLPARDSYGFYIWQVMVNKDEIGKHYRSPSKPHFETFEDESLHTFFNGDK